MKIFLRNLQHVNAILQMIIAWANSILFFLHTLIKFKYVNERSQYISGVNQDCIYSNYALVT